MTDTEADVLHLTPADIEAATRALPDEYTDTWAATEVARLLSREICYVPERECFFVWDGTTWREDALNRAPGLIGRALVYLSKRASKQARGAASDSERKAGNSFARTAQSQPFKSRITRLLTEHPDLICSVDSFDADPYSLNTPNGPIDLSTGGLSKPDPESLFAMCTNVAPEPGEPTMWLDFLTETTLNDGELIAFLQRWLGYLATGLNTEKYLLIGVGRSDSGKSVFNNVVGRIFGSYHANIPQGALLAAGGNRHPADLAAFVGARIATSSEVPVRGSRWRSDVVKQITGGDRLSVRKMRENFYEIQPRARLMLFSNHTPSTSNDGAMLRRILYVPFENHVPLEEQDRDLTDKLVQTEGGKILNWIIEGAREYLEEGLGDFPRIVKAATEEYRESEDHLSRFISDECELGAEHKETARTLFARWRSWCESNGLEKADIGTQAAFTQLMRREAEEDYGLEYTTHATCSINNTRGRGFVGIRVQSNDVFETDPVKQSQEIYGE